MFLSWGRHTSVPGTSKTREFIRRKGAKEKEIGLRRRKIEITVYFQKRVNLQPFGKRKISVDVQKRV